MTRAIAYLRTSSAANVEGDSARRQDAAVMAYAASADLQVTACFWDQAVSGADPIETRAGFSALLDVCEAEEINVVVVEGADRFARDMIAQELGILALIERGIRLVTASGQDMTDTSDPTKVMMRQIAGAFAQYEKARVVAKLKAARDRKSAELGKRIEGRKPTTTTPALITEAKRLHAADKSYRQIAAELAAAGYLTSAGTPLAPTAVKRLLNA